jgi:hypothetical protein
VHVRCASPCFAYCTSYVLPDILSYSYLVDLSASIRKLETGFEGLRLCCVEVARLRHVVHVVASAVRLWYLTTSTNSSTNILVFRQYFWLSS